ncbi:MAG: CoB--CoM heterodisulfide reductase iron-sulfur subunit B family protein [Synergistaceae bacterium]|jgi:heterodisulfide reductase subunit B|nr:CoB--CoM heterodisulfide reductase iron-sulfur subunit B family protein [Synergistaceae bacterium]
MKFSYFPGCTLKAEAGRSGETAISAAGALGVEVTELDQWQCCGAVYPLARDEIATKLSAVRALIDAKRAGLPLLTLCSACHHVIKRVNRDMAEDSDVRDRVNSYVAPEVPYGGETKVVHFLEMLRDHVGFDSVAKRVTAPLAGQRVAAYYGCMLLRPSSAMGFDDPENPSIMEGLIAAIGAEPVLYPQRNECCGGYLAIENKGAAKRRASEVVRSAAEHGADCIATTCPLCLYNLTENGAAGTMPVYDLTALLANALGLHVEPSSGCAAVCSVCSERNSAHAC